MVDRIEDAALKATVAEWLKHDRDEHTRKQTMALVDSGDTDGLVAAFGTRIAFGTAGLRSTMMTGVARMNQLVVAQTSQGLCKYLEATTGGSDFSVVIGYDGRAVADAAGLTSKAFAMRTAAAFLSRGAKVHMFGSLAPTPYVAYAVTHFKAAAGIMVTASHNPKEDNGYKVYWNNGAQITSPHDKNIAAEILDNLEPWDNAWNDNFVTSHPNLADPMAAVAEAYMVDLLKLPYKGKKPSPEEKITYTAMHGVGYEFCKAAYATAGLAPLIPVPAQVEPDAEFPTVKYPNPEEGKGALTLAIETATASGSTVILANDPDADRLAVAVLDGDEWRIFTGNEIGALFGWWTWQAYKATGAATEKACMLASTVSSMILKTIATTEGFLFEDTLTGFKWMGNRARELQTEGYTVLMSFEEAIGFAIGDRVVDKDGVSAAVVMGGMVNHLAAEGKTLISQLDAIYTEYGYHASYGSYFICSEQPTIDAIFGAIREGGYPTTVEGETVTRIRDLTTGFDDGMADNKATLPTQSAHMITLWFSSQILITLRTSGTEPKIKFYSEIVAPSGTEKEKAAVETTLRATVDKLVAVLLQPKRYKLQAKQG